MTDDAADTPLAALTARVQRLEDLEAVRATWLDYCHRLDAHDYDRLAGVFTGDATLEMDGLGPGLDGTYQGRTTIIEGFYRRTAQPRPGAAGLRHMTGHLSTNMEIELQGDEATTLAYFFEIVDDSLVLIGTYQHRVVRQADRWRFAFLRISVRYRARIEVSGDVAGQGLDAILERPIGG
ncbi:MAG: nuclear transport factor 2 family protein [Acidimicrobiales bacterium]